MKYKINELSKISGVSKRALRYYDEIGILIPKRDEISNYRFYTSNDINVLQQILLFKEMGLELSLIKDLIKDMTNDIKLKYLNDHLKLLINKRSNIDLLIDNVKATINNLKGETKMNDQDKFKGLKDELINNNNKLYKEEVIKKYGEDSYNQSLNQFRKMNEKEFYKFKTLEKEIIDLLLNIKEKDNESLRKKLYDLHKEFITISLGYYDSNIHKNIVDMYITDDRFQEYYDKHKEGLAVILNETVKKFAL